MSIARRWFATARWGLAIAVLLIAASGLWYPGGTVRDESTRGYSFTHNFLSDLGATVAFNCQRNVAGAALFIVSVVVGVAALAIAIGSTVRLLSASPRARPFARLASAAAIVACAGFLGAAIMPLDRLWRLHTLAGMLAFRSLPVVTALLSIATGRDGRFRTRATLGWAALTIVVVGIIITARLGPGVDTDRGLVMQVVMQKIMVASIIVALWFETLEGQRASRSDLASQGGDRAIARAAAG
jgi:hypothetical membrane protein